MKLLVTFTYGISLERYDRIGTIHREVSLFKELENKNIKVNFLTYGDKRDYEYADLLGQIKIFPVSKFIKSKLPLITFFKTFLLPFKLKKLFNSVDIIRTIQVYGSWIPCIAKILYNKKIVIRAGFEWLNACKNVSKKGNLKNYIKYLIRYTFIFINELISYKMADGIILTSDYDIPFVIKYYKLKKKFKKKRIQLIYNFIDENLFKPIPKKKKDKHILYIGLLHRGKNVNNLVKAFKYLEGYTLDIIGKGPDEGSMKRIAKENNLKINFLGLFPNNKIPEILNQYHIFILPSISEGNPKVLLEAMSCGLACIGTNIEGINNILKHRVNGILCDTDSKSLADAILNLYKDENLRRKIAKNARQYILDNCSLRSIAQKEFLFYQDILNEKKN